MTDREALQAIISRLEPTPGYSAGIADDIRKIASAALERPEHPVGSALTDAQWGNLLDSIDGLATQEGNGPLSENGLHRIKQSIMFYLAATPSRAPAAVSDEHIYRLADMLWEQGHISSLSRDTAVIFGRAILALAAQSAVAPMTADEHAVVRAAIWDSAEVVHPGVAPSDSEQLIAELTEQASWVPSGPAGVMHLAASALATAQPAPAGEQKGWVDEFGNVFPMGAWKPAKETYHDDHKHAWKPLYLAAAPTPDSKGAAEPTKGELAVRYLKGFADGRRVEKEARTASAASEPVAYVPRCHTDGERYIVGEFSWSEISEKPFDVNPDWECAPLYLHPSSGAQAAGQEDAAPSADAVDAKRYRWLRSIDSWAEWARVGHYAGDGLDNIIDATQASTQGADVSIDRQSGDMTHEGEM